MAQMWALKMVAWKAATMVVSMVASMEQNGADSWAECLVEPMVA
jgi:hypothetical protein